MQIVHSWLESLQLFIPKNFKLFFLVTLRSFCLALKDFFSTLWWFFLFLVVGEPVLSVWFLRGLPRWFPALFGWLLLVFYTFYLFLSVRPSITLKNNSYYIRYTGYVFYVVVILFGVEFFLNLMSGIPLPISNVVQYGLTLMLPFELLGVMPLLLISPLLVFTILFLLDSDGTPLSFFASLGRGAKMFLYNYPFCILAYFLFFGWSHVMDIAYSYVSSYLVLPHINSLFSFVLGSVLYRAVLFLFYIVGGLVPLSFLTNFYIKRVHEQFKLYFREP